MRLDLLLMLDLRIVWLLMASRRMQLVRMRDCVRHCVLIVCRGIRHWCWESSRGRARSRMCHLKMRVLLERHMFWWS